MLCRRRAVTHRPVWVIRVPRRRCSTQPVGQPRGEDVAHGALTSASTSVRPSRRASPASSPSTSMDPTSSWAVSARSSTTIRAGGSRRARERQDPLLDVVGVRVQQRRLGAHDDRPHGRREVGAVVGAVPGRVGRVADERHHRRAADARDDVDERQQGRDDEALQHAQDEDAGQREPREHDRLAPDVGEAAQRRDVPEARDRDDDDRGERRLGRSSKSGARNAPVSSTNPPAMIAASWLRAPAPSAAAVWLAPPLCTNPDEKPESRFDAPMATRSRFGSDA